MPFYYPLKKDPPFTAEMRDRTARRLVGLREQIRKQIPPRSVTNSLLLATWNIRDFDSNKFGHGPRLEESFYYIAEVISAFDLIAVQEVNKDTNALSRVMSILGPHWGYIATDVTEGSSGNSERTAFIFDKSKILFRNIVGEIVLTDKQLVGGSKQFARTPFFASFQAGWFKFNLCTVHIYYGEGAEGLERRIEEIDRVAGVLAARAKDDSGNFILLGDFNIISPEHKTMQALLKHGFVIPAPLQHKPTNMFKTKHYDQIAFLTRDGELHLGDSENNAGAFDYYEAVFTPRDFDKYKGLPGMTEESRKHWEGDEEAQRHYYEREWRTFQMSDHLPMWVELKIDFSDSYLKGLFKPEA